MDGAILVVSAVDGPMAGGDPEPPLRLEAHGAQAEAQCADANGNGLSGLVSIVSNFVDARSGAPVRVVLETLPNQDIDAIGEYEVALEVGDMRQRLVARVVFAGTPPTPERERGGNGEPDRPNRKRRGRGRRGRGGRRP